MNNTQIKGRGIGYNYKVQTNDVHHFLKSLNANQAGGNDPIDDCELLLEAFPWVIIGARLHYQRCASVLRLLLELRGLIMATEFSDME